MTSLRGSSGKRALTVMTDFVLEEKGDGKFVLQGDMSFDTANTILHNSESQFARHASLDIDLSGVERADSAGLALLLEWKSQALSRRADIRFHSIPESLLAIAKTCEVEDLI
jgi:phospholipid transport system transporter-binding protein